MKDWKLPTVGTMLLVYVLVLAIFDEPDKPVETPFDESLSASEESKKNYRHKSKNVIEPLQPKFLIKQWRASKMKFKWCTCYIENIILWNGR